MCITYPWNIFSVSFSQFILVKKGTKESYAPDSKDPRIDVD